MREHKWTAAWLMPIALAVAVFLWISYGLSVGVVMGLFAGHAELHGSSLLMAVFLSVIITALIAFALKPISAAIMLVSVSPVVFLYFYWTEKERR